MAFHKYEFEFCEYKKRFLKVFGLISLFKIQIEGDTTVYSNHIKYDGSPVLS